jgi:hypothetical protein
MSFPLYPNTTAGLAAVGPVQAMSDRNEAQTYMANGGQMFASGGIASLAEGGSTALPKYKYDPITQRYVLVEDEGKKEKGGLENLVAQRGVGGEGSADRTPSGWDLMSDKDKAAYYAENPTMAKVTQTLQTIFGRTPFGMAQKSFFPDFVDRQKTIARGVDPDYVANMNAQVERNAAQPGFDKNWGGGLRGTMGDQPGDYDGQGLGGYGTTGPGSASGIGVGSTEGINAMDAQSDAAAAAAAAADTGGYTGETYAYGGLASLARGGMSHLGDYSDGGRLLRGPGDGVSDSIPATIGDKRPARLADGEFVVPARIVSELGNGSTEAGARKLYAMMDRIQKARRKTVGKDRVAVNSRAEKNLPA